VSGRTVARGYGAEHRKLRAKLIAALVDGQPCARCGQPMWRAQARWLDLGHVDWDRRKYWGLEHRRCNRGAHRRKKATVSLFKKSVKYTSVGVDVTADLSTCYVALAGVVAGGGAAVVDLTAPTAVDTAVAVIEDLWVRLDIDHVVLDPATNGGKALRSGLEARGVGLLLVTPAQRDEAAARFVIWTRAGVLKHTGHRDLTLAARAAETRQTPSGVTQMVRRGATVDPAALVAAQLATWGLPADLEGDTGPVVCWPGYTGEPIMQRLERQTAEAWYGRGDWPGSRS
jgi:hypothetical protein